jgi:hypothetical protein
LTHGGLKVEALSDGEVLGDAGEGVHHVVEGLPLQVVYDLKGQVVGKLSVCGRSL